MKNKRGLSSIISVFLLIVVSILAATLFFAFFSDTLTDLADDIENSFINLTSNPNPLNPPNPPDIEERTYFFPSSRTFAVLFYSVDRFGTNNQIILDFLTSHFEFLIDVSPYDKIKVANPNVKNLVSASITYGVTYNYDENYIPNWGGIYELKNWIDENWTNYDWSENYVNADAAFEDCFVHVIEQIDLSFVQNNTIQTIYPYNSLNPRISRLPGPWDRNYDWVMNLGSPVYISFWKDYYSIKWTLNYPETDGIFLDSVGIGWIQSNVDINKTREYAFSIDKYNSDMKNLVNIIRNTLHTYYPEKKLAINNYNSFDNINPSKLSFEDNADVFLREGSINYKRATELLEREISSVNRVGEEGKIVLMKHQPIFYTNLTRDKIAGLATYYLAMNDNVYFLSNEVYGDDPRNYWFDVFAYDIGKPEGDYYIFASGQDPSNLSNTYKVLARNFTKALVLVKPRPSWANTNYGDLSRTFHVLPETYKVLYVNGNLGPEINSISLRNWEGAILIKVEESQQAPASDLIVVL